jgi:hypothetical protein
MADSKPVGSFTLLKKEVKRIFDEGLLLSSYNIYIATPRIRIIHLETVST